MSYLLLITEPRGSRRSRTAEEGQQVYQRMLDFGAGLSERGLLLACESLKSDTSAVRVKVRDGSRSLIDGPFTEAKEFVGGFFLLNCKTRDEAVAIACDCPAAEWATVEVREVGPCSEG